MNSAEPWTQYSGKVVHETTLHAVQASQFWPVLFCQFSHSCKSSFHELPIYVHILIARRNARSVWCSWSFTPSCAFFFLCPQQFWVLSNWIDHPGGYSRFASKNNPPLSFHNVRTTPWNYQSFYYAKHYGTTWNSCHEYARNRITPSW